MEGYFWQQTRPRTFRHPLVEQEAEDHLLDKASITFSHTLALRMVWCMFLTNI